MTKHFVSASQLLEDAFRLGWEVFDSGFRPDYVVGVWRGGAPVAVAVHELLHYLGVRADHIAVRTSFYRGIAQRADSVEVQSLDYLTERLLPGDSLLLVDDVHDTGLSIGRLLEELQAACGDAMPDVRVATPYYKPGSNLTGRVPDYVLHETEEWLVFPHELEGLSLEEIAASKPEMARVLAAMAKAGIRPA